MRFSSKSRVVTVAEIGINHNGQVDIAKKLIDVAADAGVDAVKFQKRTVDRVYTQEELAAPRQSPWGITNGDQKRGLEFGKTEYDAIASHCRLRGVEWFASCWDLESVDFINAYDEVAYHKVASALLTRDDLLAAMVSSERRVIVSTGMSSIDEITHALDIIGSSLDTVMHCTSTYPTTPDEMNMRVISNMWKCSLARTTDSPIINTRGARVGFSNHYSGLIWVPLAVALGARVLEFHITLDRTMYGSDQAASIEPDGVKKLVEHARLAERMLGDGVKCVYDSELPVRKKLRGC